MGFEVLGIRGRVGRFFLGFFGVCVDCGRVVGD